jgi:hypothetical protein
MISELVKGDIETCIDIYLPQNQEHMLPSDRATACNTMRVLLARGAFCRALWVDGKIHAWLLASAMQREFIKEPVLQQVFFGSDLKGTQAYNAVVALHLEMEKEAVRRGINLLISTGSNQDPDNTFTRILERNGWNRSGYLATRRLDGQS